MPSLHATISSSIGVESEQLRDAEDVEHLADVRLRVDHAEAPALLDVAQAMDDEYPHATRVAEHAVSEVDDRVALRITGSQHEIKAGGGEHVEFVGRTDPSRWHGTQFPASEPGWLFSRVGVAGHNLRRGRAPHQLRPPARPGGGF